MSLAAWIPDRIREYRQQRRDDKTLFVENDARAGELQTDLDRWVPDQGQQLDADLDGIVNRAGAQLYAGSLRNELEAAMELALQQYRDEARAKVRAFTALARSEAAPRRGIGPALGLTERSREVLATWRERPYPVPGAGDGQPLRPRDPTAGQAEIAALEMTGGLSWSRAAGGPE